MKGFLNEYKDIKLLVWRKVTKTPSIENSCAPNGTCGYQLSFLLFQRMDNQDTSFQKDQYIYDPKCHISQPKIMKHFLHHINNIINPEL